MENNNIREKKDFQEETDIDDLLPEMPKIVENQTISKPEPYDIESNVFSEFEDEKFCQENIINETIFSLKDENNELKNEIRKSNTKIEKKENHLNELRNQLEEQEKEVVDLRTKNKRQEEVLLSLLDLKNNQEIIITELRNSIKILKEDLEERKKENETEIFSLKKEIEIQRNLSDKKELHQEIIIGNLKNDNDRQNEELFRLREEIKKNKTENFRLKNEIHSNNFLRCDLEKEVINLNPKKISDHIKIENEMNEMKINCETNGKPLSECKEKEDVEKVNLLHKIKTQKMYKSTKTIQLLPPSLGDVDRRKLADLLATHSWEVFDVSSITSTGIIITSNKFNSNDGKYRICLTLNSNGCSAHYNKHFCVEVFIDNNPEGRGAVWPLHCTININLKNKPNAKSLETLNETKLLQEPNTFDPIIFHFTKIDINQRNLFPENSIVVECIFFQN